MNLRSSEKPWNAPKLPPAEPLDEDVEYDIAILGSGISGALAAYHLIGSGKSVVMLDKRPITSGSINASTALLQYEMDTTLTNLSAKVGRANAERAYQLCLDAIGQFDAIARDLDFSCGYKRRESLYLAGGDATAADLQAEWYARRMAGIDVTYLDRSTLNNTFGIDRPAALLSPDAAEVDPVCLTAKLLEHSVSHGLVLHGQTGVDKYEPQADGVLLHTSTGHTVKAGRVIFCTGYETEDFLGQRYVSLNSTFAVVSQPVKDFGRWQSRCLIWEADTPYFYCRTTADNRIIIGGEDEPTIDPQTRDAMLPVKTETLVRQFRAMFPEIDFTPARSWAGTFAESEDGMPYIGEHAKFPHGFFCLGYGGNGITFALLAARLLRDEIAGRSNPDAALFSFDRARMVKRLKTSG